MVKPKHNTNSKDQCNEETINIVSEIASNLSTEVIEVVINRVSNYEPENSSNAREAVNKMLQNLSSKSKTHDVTLSKMKHEQDCKEEKKEPEQDYKEEEKEPEQDYKEQEKEPEQEKEKWQDCKEEEKQQDQEKEPEQEKEKQQDCKEEEKEKDQEKEPEQEKEKHQECKELQQEKQEQQADSETKENSIESNNYIFNFLTQLQDVLSKIQSSVPPKVQPPKKYALYFISLEDDNMFLHLSYKKSDEQILYQCEKLYEFPKLFKPIKVIYIMDDCDLTDADKYVKMFMKMFGENSTRGGSYTDIILPEWQKNALDLEFETASIEKLDEIDAMIEDHHMLYKNLHLED
jgi:hypothetical protein